ncbi:MAG: DUF4440 domain-containing protein [Verrucomicrobiales bacterium]|nr:DUF4440 domain-containing protein [Verrucomicrobiales bacterium]
MSIPILERWSNAVNNHTPQEVLSLYSDDAVLIATFSPNPLNTTEDIKDYFENFLSNPGAGVKFESDSINKQEVGGNLKILSGLYTFLKEDDGNKVEVPARFTYVVDESSESQIIHHHSSQLP